MDIHFALGITQYQKVSLILFVEINLYRSYLNKVLYVDDFFRRN